ENKELKVSKNLLEDIQEVITEKEVSSLNKRLDELREAILASLSSSKRLLRLLTSFSVITS
ncbi:hypothetical protein, partial [Streptococcus pyogenes]|uniref:hypothetical protein n=1 Tax=Streptococcus pyogenes TaxID=1314 RepID=UPI003D05EB93